MKRACFAIVIALGTACGGKGVTDSTSPPVKPDTTPVQTVQRTSFTVHVTVDPADATIAGTAGVGVNGLTVRLTKAGATDAPLTAVTDATGTVRFDGLLDGAYTASVERTLSPAELSRLAPADREASTFAGGVTAAVSPPVAANASVALVAARRGSLVISEIFQYIGDPIPYNFGFYFEVFNNSDTTVDLDGMYVGRTSFNLMHADVIAPCDAPPYRSARLDSTRLWVVDGLRFPGSGTQYPVRPGEAKVIATDALDHRVASGSSNFPNLSAAQFEQVASDADTDNPTADNMLIAFNTKVGTGLGRGLRVSGPGAIALIRPTALTRVQQAVLDPVNQQNGAGVPFQPTTIWGIAREDVIDVFSEDYSPGYKAYLATTTVRYTLCQPFLARAFDLAPAEVVDPSYRPGAVRRRSLGRTADGREILMRTRTSARDLEVTTNLLQRSLNK